MTDAAGHCNNWSYSHAGDADYTDILLVSQWHAVIGSSRPPKMPSLEEMPAAKKLGPGGAITETEPKNRRGGRLGDRASRRLARWR